MSHGKLNHLLIILHRINHFSKCHRRASLSTYCYNVLKLIVGEAITSEQENDVSHFNVRLKSWTAIVWRRNYIGMLLCVLLEMEISSFVNNLKAQVLGLSVYQDFTLLNGKLIVSKSRLIWVEIRYSIRDFGQPSCSVDTRFATKSIFSLYIKTFDVQLTRIS